MPREVRPPRLEMERRMQRRCAQGPVGPEGRFGGGGGGAGAGRLGNRLRRSCLILEFFPTLSLGK